jgi:uncharacterized protein YigE (DUF2233 family)
MKQTKVLFYLFLFSAFMLLTAYTLLQDKEHEPRSISLEKYNRISNTIDSIENTVKSIQKENDRAGSEIIKFKNQKLALNTECSAVKKNDKLDTSQFFIDSLQKVSLKCDSLSGKIRSLDRSIATLEADIVKWKQAIKSLNVDLEVNKELLEIEIRTVNSLIKTKSGALSLKFKGVDYHVFVTNTDSNEIKMHLQDKAGKNFVSIKNLLSYFISQKIAPLMITNGGMYMPNLQPQGLFIAQKELHPIDLKRPRTDANFYLMPNGVFYIDSLGKSHIEVTEEFNKQYESKRIAIDYATQSGPMLVINGGIHESFTKGSNNKKIRSGVGIIDGKKTVFAISLDEANFYDFALLFRDILGSKDALFLDGAISLMYLKDLAPGTLGGQFGPMISVTNKNITTNK